MEDRKKEIEITLTEEEQLFVKEKYDSGIKNPTSLVALLYSQGNNLPFTKLKNMVTKLLKIVEPYKSISAAMNDVNLKEIERNVND